MTIEALTEFLGWCTALNVGLLILASVALTLARGPLTRIHAGMFGMSQEDLARAYVQYLAQYKIAVFVLNLFPYLALKIMG